jgi:Glutathione S-transferase, N-terminal domain
MIRLHDSLISGNGYKVRLLLTQLGITFERIEYDLVGGETRTPEFLQKINPNGRIPVIETEDGSFPSPGRSCSTSRTVRRTFRTGGSRGRKSCSGCSSSSTATSRTSPCRAPGSTSAWR